MTGLTNGKKSDEEANNNNNITIDNTPIIPWKHGEFIITCYNVFLLSDNFIIDRCLLPYSFVSEYMRWSCIL